MTLRVHRPSNDLAAAWAKVLSVPQEQVSRKDHFFDRGGTSLSAVKLAVNLDRAFSLKDLTSHPVLADLAALVDGQVEAARRAAAAAVGAGRYRRSVRWCVFRMPAAMR